MWKINSDVPYIEERYSTPSYIINKMIYLPNNNYNLKNNQDIQLFVVYRQLLSTLYAIRQYINQADRLIEDDLQTQLRLLELDYPTMRETYATYCSTILNLLYKDNFTFSDFAIQELYQKLKNKIIYTTYATNIINNIARFINSRVDRYNLLIDSLNMSLNKNYTKLNPSTNYIVENYLNIVTTNIEIYKNENNN